MYKFVLFYLVSAFGLLSTKAVPKIVVLQSVNGSEAVVSSSVRTINGTSLFLICKMITTEVDTKSENHSDNNRVIWSRKRRKSRFSNIDDLVLMANSVPDARLNFTNVTLKDQGLYFCTSLKYKVLKVLNLVVQSEFPLGIANKDASSLNSSTAWKNHSSDSVQRVARDVVLLPPRPYNYTGNFTPFAYTYPPISQLTMKNEFSDWLYEDYNKKKNLETDVTLHNDPPNWFYKDNDHNNSESLNARSSLLNFFYLMIGALFLFAIIYVAIKCCNDGNNHSIPDCTIYQPRNQPITNRNICSHLVCIQNRSTHPFAECIVGTNNSHLQVAAGRSHENLRTNNLDLPPSYDESTANLNQNSKHDANNGFSGLNSSNDSNALPPSYEEALSNTPNISANSNREGCNAGSFSGVRSTYLDSGGGMNI